MDLAFDLAKRQIFEFSLGAFLVTALSMGCVEYLDGAPSSLAGSRTVAFFPG